jgi:proteasome lid subunit RPN8/RPN11
VTSEAPAQLRSGLGLLTVLRQILACAGPQEGCALLLGQRLGDVWRLDWVWPCCNVWPVSDERCRYFAIDPREQLRAQKWGRERGMELLGSAHSHPASPAEPSATDLALAVAPTLMLIRSGLHQGLPALRAWWIPEIEGGDEPPAAPTELPIDLLPDAPRSERLGE